LLLIQLADELNHVWAFSVVNQHMACQL